MTDAERLDQIKKRLEHNAYVVHPMTDVDIREDLRFLISQLEKAEAKAVELERQNKLVVQQNLELTVAIENVKADFEGRLDR